VNPNQLKDNFGTTLLSNFNGSLAQLLGKHYPNYDWQVWRFERVPPGFWNEAENVFKYLAFLMKEFDITKMEDWYKIKLTDVQDRYGSTLLHLHKNSMPQLLQKYFPDFEWQLWRFEKVPQGYWESPEHIRTYLEWVKKEHAMRSADDWYRIYSTTLRDKYYGGTLLEKHNFNLAQILRKAYPDTEWDEGKFARKPSGYWSEKENRVRLVKELEEKL